MNRTLFKYIMKVFISILFTTFLFLSCSRDWSNPISPDEVNNNSNSIPTNSLVAYYPFNGNANDESGNGNDGTEFGGVTYVNGKINQAAKFDGLNDYIRNSNPPVLHVLGSIFSINFWIKTESNQNSGVINIGQETKATWSIGHNNQLVIFNQNWNRPIGFEWFQEKIPVSLNEWNHITYVYSNRHIDAYLNAVFVAGANFINNPVIEGDEWIEVGVDAPGGDEYFKGQIDEIRIYNRALSLEEIQALYHEEGWGN